MRLTNQMLFALLCNPKNAINKSARPEQKLQTGALKQTHNDECDSKLFQALFDDASTTIKERASDMKFSHDVRVTQSDVSRILDRVESVLSKKTIAATKVELRCAYDACKGLRDEEKIVAYMANLLKYANIPTRNIYKMRDQDIKKDSINIKEARELYIAFVDQFFLKHSQNPKALHTYIEQKDKFKEKIEYYRMKCIDAIIPEEKEMALYLFLHSTHANKNSKELSESFDLYQRVGYGNPESLAIKHFAFDYIGSRINPIDFVLNTSLKNRVDF